MDYRQILESVYQPGAYASRIDRLMSVLDRSRHANNCLSMTCFPGRAPQTCNRGVRPLPMRNASPWLNRPQMRQTTRRRHASRSPRSWPIRILDRSRRALQPIDGCLAALDGQHCAAPCRTMPLAEFVGNRVPIEITDQSWTSSILRDLALIGFKLLCFSSPVQLSESVYVFLRL